MKPTWQKFISYLRWNKPWLGEVPFPNYCKCDLCSKFCSYKTCKVFRDWESGNVEELQCADCYQRIEAQRKSTLGLPSKYNEIQCPT